MTHQAWLDPWCAQKRGGRLPWGLMGSKGWDGSCWVVPESNSRCASSEIVSASKWVRRDVSRLKIPRFRLIILTVFKDWLPSMKNRRAAPLYRMSCWCWVMDIMATNLYSVQDVCMRFIDVFMCFVGSLNGGWKRKWGYYDAIYQFCKVLQGCAMRGR